MINIEDYPSAPLIKGIKDLNECLKEQNVHITIDAVGGFAMLMQGNRNPNNYTDIDYVGADFSSEVIDAIKIIGRKNGMEDAWINNDLMLKGQSIEDFECSSGKLHFTHAFSLSNITVNVLDPDDLLRMKVIAIDTALTAISLGGDFTRAKDFDDIAVLLNDEFDESKLLNLCGEYIINEKTLPVISEYIKNGLDAAKKMILGDKPLPIEDLMLGLANESQGSDSVLGLEMVNALKSGNLMQFLQDKLNERNKGDSYEHSE